MIVRPDHGLPPEIESELKRARRLEWITIGFLTSITILMYLTMGSSQAMKTAWIEDVLSLIPPILFLIATGKRRKSPNADFPYGYERATGIAFLGAAVALSLVGLFMIYDSSMGLLKAHHPTIGSVEILGYNVWMGYVMMAALLYSAIPPVILGRKKLPLARKLHLKALHTDADMNKADWMTAVSAIVGITLIGFGFWWGDAVAALIISIDVFYDGVRNTRSSIRQLSDERPTEVGSQTPDPLIESVRDAVSGLGWVVDCDVRLREEGYSLTGEVYVVPDEDRNMIEKLAEASETASAVHWRVGDVVATAVRTLDDLEKSLESRQQSVREDGRTS